MAAASKTDISGWFDRGVKDKQGYMIIVCDTFDFDDYPVYCDAKDFEGKYREHDDHNMQKVMEVYDLSKPKEPQMNAERSYNYPPGFQP